MQWFLNGTMSLAMEQQVTYHAMFDTFKEDLEILTSITDCGSWKTKEEMDACKKLNRALLV